MIPRRIYFLLLMLYIYYLKYTKAQTEDEETLKRIKELFNFTLIKSPDPPSTTSANVEECECVKYYLCNGTHINANGEGIIDIRNNDNRCESYLDFCCIPNEIVPVIQPHNAVNHPVGCGWRNPDGVGFQIVGDNNAEAKFGEFPWMVAILREEQTNGKILSIYQCGGTLIHARAVITAAHCVSSENSYVARAGEWDTQTKKEILIHQNRRVKSITKHPDYYSGALYNDVALLILETPFVLDKHIDVACLPRHGTLISSDTKCWATGWGKNLFGAEGRYQVIMNKIDLPFVNSNTCENSLRTTRLGRYFRLHESFVCAGGEPGKDTCQGDGGSPLVCPIPGQNERYQHIGIVAWGIGCGENGIPGVYGNVALFRNWIDQEMTKNNLETSQYQY